MTDKAETETPVTPDLYLKEFEKFQRAVASEDDPETLGGLQVKLRGMLIKMGALKIYAPPAWSDAHNACGDKMARLQAEAFHRRMG